jgi:PIN domain nuclease of toxin-antitoxin system
VRLLLDTNIAISLLEERTGLLPAALREALRTNEGSRHVSVASLWEISIKSRLGKLPLRAPLERIPEALTEAGIHLLMIEAPHVLTWIEPEPDTRDPFDTLLLAQCLVEGMRLLTTDRALTAHRLAWRPT